MRREHSVGVNLTGRQHEVLDTAKKVHAQQLGHIQSNDRHESIPGRIVS